MSKLTVYPDGTDFIRPFCAKLEFIKTLDSDEKDYLRIVEVLRKHFIIS